MRGQLTDEQREEARRLFYGEKRNLGQVAQTLGCSVYALSPWLYQEALDAVLDRLESRLGEGPDGES